MFLRRGLLSKWPINCLGSFSFGPSWFRVSRSGRQWGFMKPEGWFSIFHPSSGQAIGSTPFLQHHLLVCSPARWRSHGWCSKRAGRCAERCSSLAATWKRRGESPLLINLACTQLKRWWRSWGEILATFVACFSAGFPSPQGAVCCAPVRRVHRRRGATSCRPLRGTPCARRAQAATKRKHAGRITALQAAVQSKGRAADLVATCPFTSLEFLLLRLICHPGSARVAHLMTCSCRSCSVIDLQQGWCGWKLVWVFPAMSVGLFKDRNSSSKPGLAVSYVNRRSPCSPHE